MCSGGQVSEEERSRDATEHLLHCYEIFQFPDDREHLVVQYVEYSVSLCYSLRLSRSMWTTAQVAAPARGEVHQYNTVWTELNTVI